MSYDANEKSYGINGAAAVVDESELDEQKYTLKTRSTVSRLYYESFRTTERIQYDLIVETLTMISNHSNTNKQRVPCWSFCRVRQTSKYLKQPQYRAAVWSIVFLHWFTDFLIY